MATTTKHAGGRPTKYDPLFIKKVDEYLETTGRLHQELPTKQGFALFIGVDDDTLDNWANAKDDKGQLIRPEFFGSLKKLMQLQATQLINDGIYGGKEVNPTIIKLLLQNNHGMREKTDTDITSGGESIAIKIVSDVGNNTTNTELPESAGDI